jgi:hypothetical protein
MIRLRETKRGRPWYRTVLGDPPMFMEELENTQDSGLKPKE